MNTKEKEMNEILVPENCNYIGVFLTLHCNQNCGYCLNKFGTLKSCEEMDGYNWVQGLSRIKTRRDLPITLQGGEPTIHPRFYYIVNQLYEAERDMDLLTNGNFNIYDFMAKISPEVFNRQAKYAPIRISLHSGINAVKLLSDIHILKRRGYNVGVWGIKHPSEVHKKLNYLFARECKSMGIDFRMKEFLSKIFGTYKYEGACLGGKGKKVMCKGSEVLISPSGHLYRCHSDLYAMRDPYAHILDKEIKFPEWLECENFGLCNPCDIKVTTNRFQEGGHCSVEIKEV